MEEKPKAFFLDISIHIYGPMAIQHRWWICAWWSNGTGTCLSSPSSRSRVATTWALSSFVPIQSSRKMNVCHFSAVKFLSKQLFLFFWGGGGQVRVVDIIDSPTTKFKGWGHPTHVKGAAASTSQPCRRWSDPMCLAIKPYATSMCRP